MDNDFASKIPSLFLCQSVAMYGRKPRYAKFHYIYIGEPTYNPFVQSGKQKGNKLI
jgi:hypothetical protein